MGFLLGLILPLIIIAIPLLGQIVFSNKAIKNNNTTLIVYIGITALVVGLFTPLLATFISLKGLLWNAEQGSCATGAATFVFFGYIFTFITIPLTISFAFTSHSRNKRLRADHGKSRG